MKAIDLIALVAMVALGVAFSIALESLGLPFPLLS
jgi:hypothetical protein